MAVHAESIQQNNLTIPEKTITMAISGFLGCKFFTVINPVAGAALGAIYSSINDITSPSFNSFFDLIQDNKTASKAFKIAKFVIQLFANLFIANFFIGLTVAEVCKAAIATAPIFGLIISVKIIKAIKDVFTNLYHAKPAK